MPRHPDELSEAPLARQVTVGLSKLGLALRTHAWRESGPRGLNPTQAQILSLLLASAAPLRLSDVAAGLAVTGPTASDAVKALVAKGLVAKTREPDDARAVALVLTDMGRETAARSAAWPDFVLAAVDALSLDEQAVFMRALLKMIRTLQERGEIAPARMCISCTFFRPHAHPGDAERPHHCAFVDAPFGDRALRLECREHEAAGDERTTHNWREFVAVGGGAGESDSTPNA